MEFRIELFLESNLNNFNIFNLCDNLSPNSPQDQLKKYQNQKFVVTLINPHYRDQGQNVHQQIGPERFRNPEAFNDIKQLIDTNQEDIIQDNVSNKKYKCFFDKCRKSYFTVQLLITHQKIHVRKSISLFLIQFTQNNAKLNLSP